ncbi:hypothetical protein ALC57_03044, partial [Trachymyrmex cornetzi]
RRYTIQDKLFCLGIYRRSTAAYKFISKYLPCPSISTLDKQLQKIALHSGCNKIIVKYLKVIAKEINPKDLNVMLIWDEMSLKPFIHYDKKQNKIIGFEDWSIQRTRKFADHVIVFYVRCLASGNHMPLGYGFCQSTTRTVQLLNCIKQWLTVLINCGFKPRATVCDQGGTNMAAVNMFVKESNDVRQNTFLFKNHEIIPLYDYVHLQKGIRNNLLTKDLVNNKYEKESQKQYASWKDIIIAYEMDKYSLLTQRQMPKIIDRHIYANQIPKMKVKYAVQVISHTFANFIDLVIT